MDDREARGLAEIFSAEAALREAESASEDAQRRVAYAEAEQHAERAIALLPENAHAHFLRFAARGRVAQLGGLAVAALQLRSLNAELDEVLRLDPNHADALASRGGMLMKLPWALGGNTDRGIEMLERAVALEPAAVGKRLELAEAYHIVGREDDAEQLALEAENVARQNEDPEKEQTAARFRVALKSACAGCNIDVIGR